MTRQRFRGGGNFPAVSSFSQLSSSLAAASGKSQVDFGVVELVGAWTTRQEVRSSADGMRGVADAKAYTMEDYTHVAALLESCQTRRTGVDLQTCRLADLQTRRLADSQLSRSFPRKEKRRSTRRRPRRLAKSGPIVEIDWPSWI
jgi:hypothetical protein